MNSKKIYTFLFLLLSLFINCRSVLEKPDKYSNHSYWYRYQRFLPESMRFQEADLPTEEFWTWKQNQIHLDRFQKAKNKECMVILLHGGGGNGRILGTLSKPILKTSCDVLAPDLPGYGLSGIHKDYTITYDDWVVLINDLIEKERKDYKRIYLFGLSIGGMLAYHSAAYNGNVQGILVTTLVDPRDSETRDAVSANLFLSRVGLPINSLFYWVTDDINLPIKWLSKMELITNDPSFSEIFENDPYAGGSKVSFGFLRTFLNYKPKVEPEKFQVCPVLLVHPAIDPWTPLALSQKTFNKLPSSKKLVVLEGAGHYPYEEPGVSQLNREILLFLKNN
ncbi:MAG: alpha/beta hydrolase [Leptospiraceae bacterium]|nr:alpha/beta hydrolase [Leptospiraceae bacterium]